MKKLTLLVTGVLLAAALAGCGGESAGETDLETPAETSSVPTATETQPVSEDETLGTYTCVSLTMEEVDLVEPGQSLRLEEGGLAYVCLAEEADEAQWTLNGTSLILTAAGEEIGRGTLEGDVITMTLMGAEGIFVKEGSQAAETWAAQTATQEETEETTQTYATFSCCSGLYYVTYPTQRFRLATDGLTDLVCDEDGTQGWVTKLGTEEMVTNWLTSFAETASQNDTAVRYEYPAADTKAQVIVYEEDGLWHSQILVDFGQDQGNETYPMYAAYLYFTGPTAEAVWDQDIQSMLASLRLGVVG